MSEKAIQLVLAQLTVIIFASGVLISQPRLAGIVAALLLASLAYSFGTTLATLFRHVSNDHAESASLCIPSLATHLGGIICYMVMLDVALRQIT